MTTNASTGTSIPVTQLPAAITAYLVAHRARDLDTAMAHYAPDAAVTDEGHTYTGPDEIRQLLASAASEYTYTIELTAARELDGNHYVAVHHLEGDFPGGVADLQFTFTLRDGLIDQLVIAP
jgi:ketosteroid isomerase-like protein